MTETPEAAALRLAQDAEARTRSIVSLSEMAELRGMSPAAREIGAEAAETLAQWAADAAANAADHARAARADWELASAHADRANRAAGEAWAAVERIWGTNAEH